MGKFDYVIVGAGSAGCVLAYRLSENPANKVLLIEAGPSDDHPFIHMPKGIGKIMANMRYVWPYMTTKAPSTNDTEEFFGRGKTLGGSSAINGMMYVRGQDADYDELAALTSDDWSWKHIGAAYKALENHELGAAETRGDSGPLHVTMPDIRDPITDATIEAAIAMGMERREDVNSPEDGERAGYAPRTVYKGKRESAARAFLNPIRSRPNLTIVTAVTVDKIELEDKRAVAVIGSRNGEAVRYEASREVILCAGALGSPAILQRSGIGPADHLRAIGVNVLHDSPGVGANLREHRALVMQWKTKTPEVSQNREYTGLRLVKNVMEYYLKRSGPMSAATYEAGAWFKTRPELDRPDGQLLIAPYTFDFESGAVKVEDHGGINICAYILRPESSGTVLAKSANPEDLPLISPNFHALEVDRKKMVDVLRYTRALMARPEVAPLIDSETRPGAAYDSDEEIIAAFDQMGNGAYHASGSVTMGPGDDAPLDTRLRVKGIDGLRVADTSIMPFIVAGNTNGPAMAMAWRGADLILEDAG